MMSDVELGVLLSGGVDSALIAASAQRHSQRSLKAFTVGFKDAEASGVDEIDDARRTADILGLEHRTARIGFDDFLETLHECVGIVEEPLATTSIVPMHYLSRLAGSHVKVVLSGQGADEALGGYGRYQGELFRRFVPSRLARCGRRLTAAVGLKSERIIRGLAALAHDVDVERFLEAYAVFSDAEIACLAGAMPTAANRKVEYLYQLLECGGLPTSVARMMALDLRLGLSDDLLLYTDKITMRHSLECRVPILDLELVAFIESLPADYRVRIGQGKIIHKKFAEQSLPESIVHRKKQGFLSPTRTWFGDGDRLRSILLNRSSKFANYFDLKVVDNVINQHQQGYNRERHIFLLLCLHFWFADFA
jgi:asparagine synthase (glutamine-hydrolysing)